jgi:hypothetical protein
MDASAGGSEPRGRGRERLLIDVESKQSAGGTNQPENRLGVTAAADRSIHHMVARPKGEPVEALAK